LIELKVLNHDIVLELHSFLDGGSIVAFPHASCDFSKCISILYSKQVDDKLYIYLEYVSGGSIHKLLQEYGQFGEQAIRSYTKQILLGLAYLHAKNTVHR